MRKTQKSQSSENEFGKLAFVSILLPVSFAPSYRGYAKTVMSVPLLTRKDYSTDILRVNPLHQQRQRNETQSRVRPVDTGVEPDSANEKTGGGYQKTDGICVHGVFSFFFFRGTGVYGGSHIVLTNLSLLS
jgi:hypothetical protein